MKKHNGFSLIELVVVCAIFALMFSIVAAIFSFNADAMNKSMESIKLNEMNAELFGKLEAELNSITTLGSFKFKELITDFSFEFECYNTYGNIEAPVLKVKYSRSFDKITYKYSLVKEVFIKLRRGEENETRIYSTVVFKNADNIKLEVYNGNEELNEYFVNMQFNRIVLKIENGKTKFDFNKDLSVL